MQHRPAHSLSRLLTPDRLVADIVVFICDIGGQGRGRRGAGRRSQTHDPVGGKRWGEGSRGERRRPWWGEGVQSRTNYKEDDRDRKTQEDRGVEATKYRGAAGEDVRLCGRGGVPRDWGTHGG